MHIPRFFRTIALAAVVLLSLSRAATAQITVISEFATWDYLHPTDGVNPAASDFDFATTWFSYAGDYDGPAFTVGKAGPFSYGGIDYWGATGSFIGDKGTATAPASGLRYTAYFKKQFTIPEDYLDMNLVMLVDDGAVIYIDGIERKRVNMSGNAKPNGVGDDYTMLADAASSEAALLAPVSLGFVSAGEHTIAISVHNADTTSSDLGLWVRLLSEPPGTPIMKASIGGVNSDVGVFTGFTGWLVNDPYAFNLSAVAGRHVLESRPVNLQNVGEAYFSMQMYCYEVSTSSNFELEDEFSAKLVMIMDDDTQTEISLLPPDLDLDGNGVLTGEEFNPGMFPVTDAIAVGRQLSATIPANARSVSLVVTGAADSDSEDLRIGGAMLSDTPLDADEDGDGVGYAAEIFAGTNPQDKASFFQMSDFNYTKGADGNYNFNTIFPAVGGKIYAAEESLNGGTTFSLLGFLNPPNTATLTVPIILGAAPPPAYFVRLRCIP